jgi:pSer/pThr/pTyr-binding forkhead associated (FHA) protein
MVLMEIILSSSDREHPMPSTSKNLGILTPLGGGDPVPLMKETVLIGRRPTCDVCLDFENVSSKHCELRFLHGVWHVRDLGSTNGTTVNGMKITSPQSVTPDVEVGFADHLFTIEYEPAGPASFAETKGVIDEDISEARKHTSLMELAGLETDDKPVKRRPTKPPASIERLSVDEAEFEDALPEHVKKAPKKDVGPSDDDFFNLIEDEIKK